MPPVQLRKEEVRPLLHLAHQAPSEAHTAMHHQVWIYFNIQVDCITTLMKQRTYLSTYDNIGLNLLYHSLLSALEIVLLCHHHLKLA